MEDISKERLIELIRNNIVDAKFQELDEKQDITELGMDSIGFIQLIVEIEDEIGKEIPDSYLLLEEMNTLQKIYNVICLISQ
mgnify:CR=1 FL=1